MVVDSMLPRQLWPAVMGRGVWLSDCHPQENPVHLGWGATPKADRSGQFRPPSSSTHTLIHLLVASLGRPRGKCGQWDKQKQTTAKITMKTWTESFNRRGWSVLQQCQSPCYESCFSVCLILSLSPEEGKSNVSTFKHGCMWVGHAPMYLFPLLNRKSFLASCVSEEIHSSR